MAMPQAELAQRVEDVAVEPHIRLGKTLGARPGLRQQREGAVGVARSLGHQGKTTGGYAFPGRITELAGSGKSLLEELSSSDLVAAGQLNLTQERLRPRQECQPVVTLSEPDRRIELLDGRIEVAAEEADPAKHRTRVRFAPALPRRLRERYCLLQKLGRSPVVRTVAFNRAEVRHRLCRDRS